MSLKDHASFPFRFFLSFFPLARRLFRCVLLDWRPNEGNRTETDRNRFAHQRSHKVPQFPATEGKKDVPIRCEATRARFNLPRAGKTGGKLKIQAIRPRKFSVRRRKWTHSKRCRSSRLSPERFPPLRSVFRCAFSFSRRRSVFFRPQRGLFIGGATWMLFFTICKYNFVGLNGLKAAYTLAVNTRERCYRYVIGSPPPPVAP